MTHIPTTMATRVLFAPGPRRPMTTHLCPQFLNLATPVYAETRVGLEREPLVLNKGKAQGGGPKNLVHLIRN